MGSIRHLNLIQMCRPFFRKISLLLDAIKFQESVFALPFAYTGMVLAADGLPTWHQFIWITIAMVTARTIGMSANRIIDHSIDSRNPRHLQRHLPSGKLQVLDMMILNMSSLIIFFIASAQLNKLALILAPVAAIYIIAYPYAKRFTWTASLILGCALAIAPSAAWIGVTGSLTWNPVLLSIAVALWASSFDILYHTQDKEFYLRDGLHSIAERFGMLAAFRWTRYLDALSIICLFSLGVNMSLSWPYYVGCSISASLLVYKHTMVSPHDVSRLGTAFFRINSYISTAIFIGTLASVLLSQ